MSERPADQSPAWRTDRVIGILLPAIAGVLATTGAILQAMPDPPVTFGWVASVSLSARSFIPTPWFSLYLRSAGGVLLIIGLILGVGALLFVFRSRVGRRDQPEAIHSGRGE
jgi:hypothetical protein